MAKQPEPPSFPKGGLGGGSEEKQGDGGHLGSGEPLQSDDKSTEKVRYTEHFAEETG